MHMSPKMQVTTKKALKNLSNLVNNQQSNKVQQSLKRSHEGSPIRENCLKKKSSIKDANDENSFPDTFNHDPTRTIECKIKNIAISNATEKPIVKIKNSTSVKAKKSILKEQTKKENNDWKEFYHPPDYLPKNVVDYDKTQINNIDSEPIYAYSIFQYYRQKELFTKCNKYMDNQKELSPKMRTVLVDWLVEVQQTFELNHETLYLAVKIMDHFLMRSNISRERFQLLGLTAVLIAAKVDERVFPIIDDFLYICDDAYNRDDIIKMEIEILKVLQFNLNYPLSYSFLRRYARCSSQSIETLTLARYVLESSLLEYSFIDELDSKIAAASLLLALKMKNMSWNETLEFYSGYVETDLLDLMKRLNDFISTKSKYVTIKNKYLDKVFFEVAKIKPLDI